MATSCYQTHEAGRTSGLALACAALVLALTAAPIRCAIDSSTVVQPYVTTSSNSGDIDLTLAASAAGVPLRVDYRDRDSAFDLDLLGASTGMCSPSGECNACSYRDANPCLVVDRYGADPALCQLPSFLGGAVSTDSLCGIGATVDATLATSYGGYGSGAVATLTAFRMRGSKLVLTITARCGWVVLPSRSAVLNQSSSSSSDAQPPPLVILEGDIRYLGSEMPFTVPAEGAEGEVERYSCYSAGLRLRGLSSRCQVLDLDLDLRFAVQRLDVVDGGDGDGGATCREAGPVLEATAHLTMRGPQARAAAAAALASAKTASTDAAAGRQQAAKQTLFSNGVAATTSYTASVDPRDSEAAAWLQSLAAQYPLVSVTPSAETLSFLIGSVRRELRSDLMATAGGAEAPLLPAGLYLETCSRQSISAMVSAVVSALSAQGVTERYVSDVVCLQLPYSGVAASELPPCAPYTAVLFNITLEIPLSGATGVTSSVLNALSGGLSGSSLSAATAVSSGSLSATADPQSLADALVGAQLAAPWACLSTERQMRMVTQLELDVQLPRGPGVEAVSAADSSQTVVSDPAPSPASTTISVSPQPASGAVDAPAVVITAPAPRSSSPGPAASDKSFSTAATAVVVVAVALALLVALVALFAIRSARKSKAAASAAAEAAAAARAAAGYAAGGALGTAPGKLLPPPPPLSPFKEKAAAASPQTIEAEPSYASTICDDGRDSGSEPVSAAAAAASAAATSQRQQRAVGPAAPAEGVVTWAAREEAVLGGAGSSLAPAASAASLEPFAAAVEAAAAAAATAAAASGRGHSSVPSGGAVTAAQMAQRHEHEEDDAPLSSVRGARISPVSSPTAAAIQPRPPPAGARADGPTPARILPVTLPPLPPLSPTGSGGSAATAAARTPVTPPGPPAPQRRGRSLRFSSASIGPSRSGSGSSSVAADAPMGAPAGTGVAVAGGATVWSNALYDAPQPLYDSCGEGGDRPTASATSAPH